ncbi:hypothetical protein [Fluviicola taffensis]|uniref:Lipoprotein n=1 Tax=Fluviicola taffensis (strain DSM 16823 / NCIMB 13979 / RW262) TaxID=755732 RepID=F2IAY7_FLUTR|nr:hypothetical protein [Fluviicola taffensis]AEA45311.1 hypothetical protein Fluta_3339 [Fluviicola taffensis DSM 16823]
MKNRLTLLLSITLMGIIGCEKPVEGCMESNAENFDVYAEKENGSCLFRGSAIFYHDSQTVQNLQNAGVTDVKLYVDGVFRDNMEPYLIFDFPPDCSNQFGMQYENVDIGNLKSKTFNYAIKDQYDMVLDQGTFVITGKKCNAIKYTY